jgi:uncharacterized Ntn-hydrolase superfamily protein
MLDALDAAQVAGGDARGTQAAAIVVTKPLAGRDLAIASSTCVSTTTAPHWWNSDGC